MNKQNIKFWLQNAITFILSFAISFSIASHLLRFWYRTPFVKIGILVLLPVFTFMLLKIIYSKIQTQKHVNLIMIGGYSFLISVIALIYIFSDIQQLPQPLKSIEIYTYGNDIRDETVIKRINIDGKNVPTYKIAKTGNWIKTDKYDEENVLLIEGEGKLEYQFVSNPKQHISLNFLANPNGGKATIVIDKNKKILDLYNKEKTEIKYGIAIFNGLPWILIAVSDLFTLWAMVFVIFFLCTLGYWKINYSQNKKLFFSGQKLLILLITIIQAKLVFDTFTKIQQIEVDLPIRILFICMISIILYAIIVWLNANWGEPCNKFFSYLLLIFSFLSTAAYPIMGWWMRYVSDDFGFMVELRKGVFPVISEFYLSLFGRYSNILLISSAYPFSPYLAKFIPVLSIVFFVILLTMIIKEFAGYLNIKSHILTYLSISIFIVSLWFAFLPNILQSYLWMVGNFTYFFPLIFLLLNILILISTIKKPHILKYLLLFSVSFFVSGFSEPLTLALMVGSISMGVLFVWRKKILPQVKNSLYTMASGYLSGGLICLLAPGNYARLEATSGSTTDILGVINRFFSLPVWYINDQIFKNSPMIVALLLLAFLNSALYFRHLSIRFFTKVLIIIFLMYWSSFLVFAFVGEPTSRSLSVTSLLLLCVFSVIGFFLGRFIKANCLITNLFVKSILLVILFSNSLYSWDIFINNIDELQKFSQKWDIRHAELMQQKGKSQTIAITTIPADTSTILEELGGIRLHDKRLIDYYGFDNIVFGEK